ncbi:cytochrome P450 2J4-like [Erpetoichthys calabaricus]|uniref:Cytochrome P450 2J2-like n=1 Tax=Erpetoichthys calabaricus TaxID=27687 RepID=A0A8C4XFZ7_ERPCA|nr:cytochrome P450 2J4-like [Erpetoichthys calabaricus]
MAFLRLLSGCVWENLDMTSLLVFAFIFLLLSDYIKHRAPKNFPPSPLGLPFLGNVFSLDSKQTYVYIGKLAEQYGDVFSLRLGGETTVFVSGYKTVKDLLVTQTDALTSRPAAPLFERINKCQGVTVNNGYPWRQQRRFTLSTLRNFGVGKKSLESIVSEEICFFHKTFKEEGGKPFNPHFIINNAVSNIICSIVFGHRFDYSDSRFQELLHLISEITYLEGTLWVQVYNAFPRLMKLLPGRHNQLFFYFERIMDFLREEIREHKVEWDPSSPRDYIDCYLAEIENRKNDVEAQFHEENLAYCLLDLFVAGTETTSTTLRWALLYMMKYPHVQEQVRAEIDSVIGRERPPSMEDRTNMPYTDAVIHEIQRFSNIVPLGLLRKTNEDVTLSGCFIPKNTTVVINLTSVLFDKNEWETPDSFNPGHFLNADGKFKRKDAFMAFSAGKRSCLGESLARMELFLFFSSLLQKFTFHTPEGVQLSLQSQNGLTRTPVMREICAVAR